jgi:NAD(P)H-dependent flavin oxidoreductase YrpB (nitropropane dioxygenase family)
MMTPFAKQLGAEFPIFAFSHCRDVVAAVSRSGGVGVLGALGRTPDQLDMELTWIEEAVGHLPYAVDIVIPATSLDRDSSDPDLQDRLEAMIPAGHRQFVEDLLTRHGVGKLSDGGRPIERIGNTAAEFQLVDVVLGHRPRMLVNALGPMPKAVVDRVHQAGMLAGGLVGSPVHAQRQRANGVDVMVAQGTEAAGHTGQISTMVLVPQVVDAVAPAPVLAAGGIASGRQIAAALALGAQGAWTGTIWLTVDESDTDPALKARILAATSADTTQTKSMTGKPNRFLRNAWTDAWAADGAPEPLPWPLQLKLSSPAITRITRSQNPQLVGTSVGQSVGMVNAVRPARRVLLDLVEEYVEAIRPLQEPLEDADGRRDR